MSTIINRRSFVHAMAAIGGIAALGPRSVRAQAANKRIVLSTWGGDYGKLLTKHVSVPVLQPRGWEVVNDEAVVAQRKTKTLAERRLAKGTSDVQALTATDIAELRDAGVLEKLDLARLRNAKNIIKTFSIAESPYFSPHIFSGKVVLYNPKLIKKVPTGIADLWDPANEGKVGVVDIQHVYTTMAAALVAGGKTGDFEKAKKALLDLKKLKPRIYPSNEALAQALQTEEVGLCIMWKARAVQWQNAGANIRTVAPKEGLITYVSGFAIPKNAPNRDGSYAFLDAALEASVQEGFAADMGYNPVVGNAKVPAGLRARIGFTPEEEKLFVNPDLDFLAKSAIELKDFWDKQFKAG
ncbi:MAG: extracellular solute-binding protein [Alphaproteobacteria bacterium]|nr:extracellular solute-binding protein [Alphaproteobacteria bacterium]